MRGKLSYYSHYCTLASYNNSISYSRRRMAPNTVIENVHLQYLYYRVALTVIVTIIYAWQNADFEAMDKTPRFGFRESSNQRIPLSSLLLQLLTISVTLLPGCISATSKYATNNVFYVLPGKSTKAFPESDYCAYKFVFR
jgi:hypothetical protein